MVENRRIMKIDKKGAKMAKNKRKCEKKTEKNEGTENSKDCIWDKGDRMENMTRKSRMAEA